MRPPRTRNSPVNQARKRAWLNDFVGYRSAVNEGRIDEWLEQFATADRDVAARVLDVVEFFGPDRIGHAYRQGLAALPGWHDKASMRKGRWRFVQLSASAGDSGGTMIHHFRLANGMDRSVYDKMFKFPSELVQEQLGADDTVVLLDDFVGTGNQVTTAWKDAFSELVAGAGNVYLLVVAARLGGRDHVRKETGLTVHYGYSLDEGDDFFGERCGHFTAEEKETFKKYCKKANKTAPAGYGGCGLLVVFSHRCPNDSVAALHASHARWRGLFPRHDDTTV